MSEPMRIARVLCALFVVFSCIPAAATAQRDRISAPPRNPALPPDAPGPLYAPNPYPSGIPSSAERERMLRELSTPVQSGPLPRDRSIQLQLAQPPRADDGFKPISELPPEEKLPAAPMLVAAYVFVVLALFAYVVSLSRRLNAVSRDIGRLDAQLKQR